MIIFLDNDKTNFNKENLYKVSRALGGIMVGNDLHDTKQISKETIIKYCEWKEKIFNLEGKKTKEELI